MAEERSLTSRDSRARTVGKESSLSLGRRCRRPERRAQCRAAAEKGRRWTATGRTPPGGRQSWSAAVTWSAGPWPRSSWRSESGGAVGSGVWVKKIKVKKMFPWPGPDCRGPPAPPRGMAGQERGLFGAGRLRGGMPRPALCDRHLVVPRLCHPPAPWSGWKPVPSPHPPVSSVTVLPLQKRLLLPVAVSVLIN